MARLIKLSKELLNKHALSTLRVLGRVIGVKSPTSKTKNQLIEEILLMQESGVCFSGSKKGAPVKSKVDLSDFYEDEPTDILSIFEGFNKEYDFDDGNDFSNSPRSSFTFEDSEPIFETEGMIELYPAGFAFVRTREYECADKDSYMPAEIILKEKLRAGDKVKCLSKRTKDQKAPCVIEVTHVNGMPKDLIGNRPNFDELTSCYPEKRFDIGREEDVTLRFIDLFAPIGKGQRGVIVAPPKTGKTSIIKKIAKAMEDNHNGMKVFVLLIDERPEEVTDLKRSLRCEVVHSTFDESSDHHVRAAEMVLNRAKRIAEMGNDVVIFLDSLTRLTRAYNDKVENTGKTLTGGIESEALKKVKKFFGSARKIAEGGSLTIIATAMVGLGGKFEDIVYEEFKGTGNMELHLSRELSDKRIFPAIDVNKSGTRREELLFSKEELSAVCKARRVLSDRSDATNIVIDMLEKCSSTKEFVESVDSLLSPYKG